MANRVGIVTLFLLGLVICSCCAELQLGYYKGKCGTKDIESIIRGIVRDRHAYDPDITAFLLRLYFHDCIGNKRCDGSLLLSGSYSEQAAVPNYTVKGYDLIEFIKGALEAACPGVVSCTDILAVATRDAVVLAGGGHYDIPLGRLDGRTGLASEVELPAPDITPANAIAYYGEFGFSDFETVVLLGGHTVGVTHCNVIKERLYNYKGSQKYDPSLNGFYVWFLSTFICSNNPSSDNMFVFLDSPNSVRTVDNSYYQMVLKGFGILPIDSWLGSDPLTSKYVKALAENNHYFLDEFGKALIKMGNVGVLTGKDGEVRKVCYKTN